MAEQAVLHFLCGKLASGKTTLARRIAEEKRAVLFSEDLWLSRLYPGEIADFADYLRCSRRLRAALAPHVTELLRAGISVTLDFAGNAPAERAWARSLFEQAGAAHVLHVIDTPDSLCKAQLARRNADLPEGAKATTEQEFDAITRHFLPPSPVEGFTIVEYRPAES